MTGAPTRREILDRHRELIREMGWRAYEVHRAWWRPIRNRRLRQEIRQLNDEGERLQTTYWTRDQHDRLVFRVPKSPR